MLHTLPYAHRHTTHGIPRCSWWDRAFRRGPHLKTVSVHVRRYFAHVHSVSQSLKLRVLYAIIPAFIAYCYAYTLFECFPMYFLHHFLSITGLLEHTINPPTWPQLLLQFCIPKCFCNCFAVQEVESLRNCIFTV